MSEYEPEDMILDMSMLLNREGLPITVFAGGAVITGTAVPLSAYIRAVFPGWGPDTSIGGIAAQEEEAERELLELRAKDADDLTPEEEEKVRAPHVFLNLVDARYMVGNGDLAPTNQSISIRVRVSSIDAWTSGTLSVDRA